MRLLFRPASMLVAVIACLLFVPPASAYGQSIESPDIVARHAIVVDAVSGDILFEKSANQPTAMASLTKLFTAFVAIETTPLDRPMTVNDSDLVGEASMGISAGEVLSFQTLLNGMLLPSGNDAATAIARNLGQRSGDSDSQAIQRFIDRQNTRLESLGLNSTHLVNPHGLDADGHYSTARDIAAMTMYALDHEPTFAETIHTPEYTAEGHSITNTNRLLGSYDGLIGGKTGVTDNAGYCLMQVAERNGERVIIVLIGSTPDAWYSDAEILLDFGFGALATAGAVTPSGQITFAADQPAAVVVPDGGVAGLEVTAASADTAVVSQTNLIGIPQRSPWLWILTAIVVTPASVLILSQTTRRPPRRRRASSPVSQPQAAVYFDDAADGAAWQQQSGIGLPDWQHVAPDYQFSETTEWRIPSGPPNERVQHQRRGEKPYYPAFTPSFGGD